MEDLFVNVPKHIENPSANAVKKWLEEPSMGKVVSLFPISSAKLMYYIHQYYMEVELNKTIQETEEIQEKVKSLLPLLPDGKYLVCSVYFWRCGFVNLHAYAKNLKSDVQKALKH